MKTTEKFAAVDAVIANIGMTEKEFNLYVQKRQNTLAGIIQSILPVVYKKGNEFEILPHLDLSRKAEVWGYEMLPGIALAKKCRPDNNIEYTWDNNKAFAEKCLLNGKKGSLPSKAILKENWSEELRDKIIAMDKFLYHNGVDAETRYAENFGYCGSLWCSEVYNSFDAYTFSLRFGKDGHIYKYTTYIFDRLAAAFS